YVTNSGSGNVSVINGSNNTVISTISVGTEPEGVVFDPSNGYIYVANSVSSSVSLINGAIDSVISTITVGFEPYGVTIDSSNSYIYVTNAGSNSVSVINTSTNKVVSTISVGSDPYGITFDSSNDYIYVMNLNSGSVSIISTEILIKSYSVEFVESGLSSGTTWSVNLNGKTQSSASSTITFKVPNGTYSYTINNVSGYTVYPASSSITVNGNNISKDVTFKLTSPVKTPSSAVSSIELYVIIGAIIAIAAIGTFFSFLRKRK
ncbi:YncE family protein, partial [Caldiplasma sukawensis]